MLKTIFKKKVTENQLATIFVNGIFEVVDKGFQEVKSMIMEDPAFKFVPQIEEMPDGPFTMIVIVANINTLEKKFSPNQFDVLKKDVFDQFSTIFEMELSEFIDLYKSFNTFMNKVNYPSKVLLYSMTKALFFKYELNPYQENYFKKLNTPNPLFLKRMDEVMKNFIWNWEAFFKHYKLHP